MKDEHDKSTIDLLQPLSSREIAMAKLEMDRKFRQQEGLTIFLPVSMVAKDWCITSRRVRALLCAGRLEGRQLENGYWEVKYPYTLTEGRRGPLMRKYGPKKAEQRTA